MHITKMNWKVTEKRRLMKLIRMCEKLGPAVSEKLRLTDGQAKVGLRGGKQEAASYMALVCSIECAMLIRKR